MTYDAVAKQAEHIVNYRISPFECDCILMPYLVDLNLAVNSIKLGRQKRACADGNAGKSGDKMAERQENNESCRTSLPGQPQEC